MQPTNRMKYVLLLFLALSACEVKKEIIENTDTTSLNDSWKLVSLNGKEYTLGKADKHPTINLSASAKTINGTDGCNRIGGSIEILNTKELKFGPLMGTKMLCMDMTISDNFSRELANTSFYSLKNSELTLLDKDLNVLMVLTKA